MEIVSIMYRNIWDSSNICIMNVMKQSITVNEILWVVWADTLCPRTLFSSLRSFRCARIIYYGILQCSCKVRSIKGIKITSGIIKLACAQPKKNNFGIEIWQFFSKSHLLSLVISLILEMTLVLIIYISKSLDKPSYSSLSFHLL